MQERRSRRRTFRKKFRKTPQFFPRSLNETRTFFANDASRVDDRPAPALNRSVGFASLLRSVEVVF